MPLLRRIDHVLSVIESGLVIALFTALVAAIGINVVSRNLFQQSFQTLLEYSPTLVLWLALMGSTLGLRSNRHIRLELVLRFTPPGARRMAGRASALFGMAAMGILAVASFSFVDNEVAIFGSSGYTTVVFPLFFTLASFRFFINVLSPPASPTAASPDDAVDRPAGDDTEGAAS
jgi:TRAP-type C4-dicarboxylate transport system permease small subunit